MPPLPIHTSRQWIRSSAHASNWATAVVVFVTEGVGVGVADTVGTGVGVGDAEGSGDAVGRTLAHRSAVALVNDTTSSA